MNASGGTGSGLTQVAGATSAGAVLQLVRSGVTTRSDLARRTGMARSTVSQRVDALIRLGLVVETGDGPSTGGRPPTHLAFNPDGGVVIAADFGITHCRLAIAEPHWASCSRCTPASSTSGSVRTSRSTGRWSGSPS